MKGFKLTFKKVYLGYLFVLIALAIAVIVYVNGLLQKYEALRPERCVEAAIEELAKDASDEGFYTKYEVPEIEKERFEEQIDVKKQYLTLFVADNMDLKAENSKSEEDILYYAIINEGRKIAEVKLKAAGPQETMLGLLNYREWEIDEINLVLDKADYTITVPNDFTVSANDIALTSEDGVASDTKRTTYTVSNVYVKPDFDIRDKDGNEIAYTVNNTKVLAEYYYYSFTLPTAITVQVNGENIAGVDKGNNRVFYDVCLVDKPEVVLSDYYGNTVNYEEDVEIPLTYMTVLADSRYSVTIDGKDIDEAAVTLCANKEYEPLIDYVENLPLVSEFNAAILKKNAEIVVKDEDGKPVELEKGETSFDFTEAITGLDEVPSEISAEVDILGVAKSWSLFMSKDKPFKEITTHLIKGSYQYDVAYKYATGIDITFTSSHRLADPAFTENRVSNFKWITDDCFSVDVYFVKHMILNRSGNRVDDIMNSRIYFVKYDDTKDGVDNPTWKIASMRENVENGN